MSNIREQIHASRVSIAGDVVLGQGSTIRAEEVVLGQGVRIGDNVEITCDRLELGDGCSVGSNSTILCPEIVLENGCHLGASLQAELNRYFRLGRHCGIGQRATIVGQGMSSGEFLWMGDDVIVGGGGARGPRSYLTIGDRASVFGKSFINISEEVTIGDCSALSYNVVLLTHYAWQPSLLGYPTKFAPIHVGNWVVVYLNAMVLPGVTIGDYSTIGAGSLVLRDVPGHCLAAGNPAEIRRGPVDYPTALSGGQKDALVKDILADYLTTLDVKGVRAVEDRMASEGFAIVEFCGQRETIRYIRIGDGLPLEARSDITLSCGPLPDELRGRSHFDLIEESAAGELTAIAEDLRDYLRRRAIRIFTDKPFRSIPLANLQRLRKRRQAISQ